MLVLLSRVSFAQILDDSTKLVYGPTSTQYLYEDNIKFNDVYFSIIDTSVFDIHRFSTTEASLYKMQDLGVMGTASRNLFFSPPQIIGARSGFDVYETFFYAPDDFKYYDTKSPYSRIGAAIGGNGRSRVDVGFNRSDSSNFNIGIDYNRITADKQFNSTGKHDRLSDSEGYDVYMLYHTPNNKYLFLTNYSRNRTTVIDQGGVDTTEVGDYFDENAKSFLQEAKSEYMRKNLHIYHQYNPDTAFQLYQNYDWSFASSKFRDEDLGSEGDYFDKFYFSEDTTSEQNDFVTHTLESGVKGSLGKLFYLGYYKIRAYEFIYGKADADTLNFKFNLPDAKGIEHYLGGMVRIQLNRNYKLSGNLDFNLNGNQRLSGYLLAKNFDVKFLLQQYSPSYMERAYLGNHDYWLNDFKSIKTMDIQGGYLQKFGRSFVRARGNFTTVTDFVFYNKQAEPEQINGTTTLIRPGLDFSISFSKHFNIVGSADYSIVAGNTTEAFPVPDLVVNANIYYHNIFFNGNLEMQAGLDNHWKSSYYAPDYRVSTHQYFIQDRFLVPNYLISDAYLNIKLSHAYVFAKFNNWLQLVRGGEGYFAAPDYIGKRTLFDFGFYWMFFD